MDSASFLLPHERMDVYQEARRFAVSALELASRLRSHPHIADQLARAAVSIAANIAEGAGEYRSLEKARFYRIARRSSTECAALLDILRDLDLITENEHSAARRTCHAIGTALTRLTHTMEGRK